MEATKRQWYAHRDMEYLIMGKQPFNQIWDGPQGANDQPGWKGASEIRQIARIFGQSKEEIDANARLIVTAVNNFEEMVEALKFSLSVHKSQGQFDLSERMAVDKLSALLAKVKEG